MPKFRRDLVLLVITGALVGAGCSREQEPVAKESTATTVPAVAPATAAMVAVAQMQAREGLAISGSISFTQAEPDAAVAVAAHFEGAVEGLHGLHVHDVGDCSADDFTSAGGHFNPAGVPHGGPEDAERHVGDLGNIECGEDGVCYLQIESDLLTVEVGPTSVIGRAVILHEKMDDLTSQPTGAAGSRLACGVIELQI
jgi:Cu-Zn family superoxide dismutase